MANTPAFDLDAFGNNPMNCMTLIAGRTASATGHVLVGHNEDDGGHIVVRHGWVAPRDWADGALMPAEEGCAAIPQVAHTLGYYWVEYRKDVMGLSNADGFVNECGVAITSNSMGTSREGVENTECVKDGGIAYNLRRALAERAQTARDGARILMELVDEWGYAPSGRAYTIADKDEAFMFQLARGRHYMGARVPDDAIAVMPNHFNLHGLSDYPEQFYPADLVTYAVSRGWYKPAKNGDFSDFDFAKAYQAEDEFFGPRNVMRQKNGLRIALDRPWSVEKEGMPFCVKANRPVTAQMMAEILSTHYEGTRDCCAHFGPGLSPHDASSIRYICTGTTLESDLFILRGEPKLTTVMSSFGRPCQLPYIALHPLLAQPEALDPMADAGEKMETHLRPEDGASCWKDTPWWRLRAFETQAEMTFSAVTDELRALLRRMLEQGLESDAQLCEKLAALLSDGQEAEARMLAEQADENALLSAQHTLEDYARASFTAVRLSLPTNLAVQPQEGERVRAVFHTEHTPVENAMILGVVHTNTKLAFAPVIPGTLQNIGGGAYAAEFDAVRLSSVVEYAGRYMLALGGRFADGQPFAGLAEAQFHKVLCE